MGNKPIAKEHIYGEKLLERIQSSGYSIRAMAKKINISDRQLRTYLKRNEMPTYMISRIEHVLEPKTKTIWARIGVSIPVSDTELEWIMNESELQHIERYNTDGFVDFEFNEILATLFLKRAYANGESYIPMNCLKEYEEWYRNLKDKIKENK